MKLLINSISIFDQYGKYTVPLKTTRPEQEDKTFYLNKLCSNIEICFHHLSAPMKTDKLMIINLLGRQSLVTEKCCTRMTTQH